MSVTFSQSGSNLAELNVSNANFASIMVLLGYEGMECYGEFAGEALLDFQAKIDFVLGNLIAVPALDAGKPMELVTSNMIDCGRSDGYFTGRLSILQELVKQAIASGGVVVYG